MKILISAILIVFVLGHRASLANSVPSGKLGFSISPHLGFVGPGMAAGIDFNMYNLGAVNHKLRLSGAEELDGATDSIDAHLEVGYLCGLWKRSKAGYLSASLGLSVVETTFRGKEILAPTCFLTSCSGGVYEITKSMTIGLPFHLEAVLMRNFIGIGISILGNMNLDRSYGGVVIEIPLGWLPL